MVLEDSCRNPFGQVPSCYPQGTNRMIIDNDPVCADVFVNVYSATETFSRNVANITTALHAKCSALEFEVCPVHKALQAQLQYPVL